jgi:hypothetical protein
MTRWKTVSGNQATRKRFRDSAPVLAARRSGAALRVAGQLVVSGRGTCGREGGDPRTIPRRAAQSSLQAASELRQRSLPRRGHHAGRPLPRRNRGLRRRSPHTSAHELDVGRQQVRDRPLSAAVVPCRRALRGPVVQRDNHYGSSSLRRPEVAAVFETLGRASEIPPTQTGYGKTYEGLTPRR